MRRLFGILFLLHLILITALVIFVTVRGLRSGHFHTVKWYPPLLTSTACAAVLSLLWQWLIDLSTSKAFKTAFWLSPLLTCAVALFLLTIGSSVSLVVGIAALLCSVVLSLYGCWASPRFEYAIRVLKISSADSPPPKATSLILLSMLVGFLYSCLLVTGVGGARARRDKFAALFITIILLSLAWTMQVMRNTMLASISRVKYMYLGYGIDIDAHVALRDTIRHLMGSVSIGSVLVPVLGIIWGSARAMRLIAGKDQISIIKHFFVMLMFLDIFPKLKKVSTISSLVAGDTDEFMFSCANCYAGVASTLVMYGNRWGFVYVGVYNKGFMQASMDVWNMFRRTELEILIDSDLTGSFCFLSGVAVGAICSLLSGSWALAVHKSYATELSLYAFFIGYFMVIRSSTRNSESETS